MPSCRAPRATSPTATRASGPLVVAVPGMGDLRSTYDDVVPALVDAGYRVVVADLRGHGDSDTTFRTHGDDATGSRPPRARRAPRRRPGRAGRQLDGRVRRRLGRRGAPRPRARPGPAQPLPAPARFPGPAEGHGDRLPGPARAAVGRRVLGFLLLLDHEGTPLAPARRARRRHARSAARARPAALLPRPRGGARPLGRRGAAGRTSGPRPSRSSGRSTPTSPTPPPSSPGSPGRSTPAASWSPTWATTRSTRRPTSSCPPCSSSSRGCRRRSAADVPVSEDGGDRA